MKYLQGLCTFFTVLFVGLGTSGAIASENPIIKIDANGNGIAVWDTVSGGSTILIQASAYIGGTWGTPQTLVNDPNAYGQKAAMTANGASDVQAVVIWTGDASGNVALFASMLPSASDDWTTPAQISSSTESVVNTVYDVVMNDSGNIIATWSSYDSSYNQYIRSATSTIGFSNSWSTPTTVSGP